MRPFLRPLSLSLAVFLLTSCAGYRLEGRRPGPLKSIETLALPLAENRTLFPRAEALTTNTVADVLLQDGTYRLSPLEGADATLQLVLSEIQYDQARSSRFDTIRSEELSMTVTLQWHITDPMKPGTPLFSGSSSGSTL